jgi:hypothetical protein
MKARSHGLGCWVIAKFRDDGICGVDYVLLLCGCREAEVKVVAYCQLVDIMRRNIRVR